MCNIIFNPLEYGRKWYCVGLMLRRHPRERPMGWVDVSTAQVHQFIANTLSRTQHYENTPCRWSADLSQHGFNRQALSVPKHKYSAVNEIQTCSICTYIYLGRKNSLRVRVQKIGHWIFGLTRHAIVPHYRMMREPFSREKSYAKWLFKKFRNLEKRSKVCCCFRKVFVCLSFYKKMRILIQW